MSRGEFAPIWYDEYLTSMHWFFKVSLILATITLLLLYISYVRPKLLPEALVSNTEKYGLIAQNERWSGTIKITGDLVTLPGVRIDVDPGTQILVATQGDKFNIDLHPAHQKSGINDTGAVVDKIKPGQPFLDESQKISIYLSKVYASGTKEQPIIIQSNAPHRSPYDFNIISVNMGVLSNIKFSNFRRFEIGPKVTIRDSQFNDISECAICIRGGKPNVLNNLFLGSLQDHIWVYRASPVIENNSFLPTKGAGIVVDPKRVGNPQIIHNQFQMPGSSAVYFTSGSEVGGGIIAYNLFSAGDIKIPCDSRVKIFQNHIKGSLFFAKSGNCVGVYSLGLNYWELDTPKQVLSERVANKELQFKVILDGALSEPPKDVGRR